MGNNFGRIAANQISGIRQYHRNKIKEFAAGKKNKKILEIGSGIERNGYYYYSMEKYFDSSNTFEMTDINPDFGHKVLDITKMNYSNKYDIVLCLNVLEHVYDFQRGIDNIYKALRSGGTTVIAVPTFYPLHDEPGDYWRFSEHALKKMLSSFKKVRIHHKGIRQYPFTYFVEATK